MMSSVIRQETAVFLLSVLHGIGLTLAYDLLRALRRAFIHSLFAVSAEDFLYWLMAGFFTFCLAFFYTDGVIRGYVAVGIALGAVLYHFTISSAVVTGLAAVLKLIRHVVGAGLRILSKPAEKMCHKIQKLVEFITKTGYNKRKQARMREKRREYKKELKGAEQHGKKKKKAKSE